MKAEVICSYSVLNTIFANYLNKMIGTIVNTVAVLVGGLLGLVLNKKMPGRVTSIYFQAIGLFTLAIGATMAVSMEKILIIVSSLAIGSLLGEWWNLEKGAEQLSEYLKKRFKIGNERFSEGLVTAFLLFCVGSMTILGTIQEGTGGSPDLLYTKSMMDFFSAILLASAFGVGVAFSALPLFLFQVSLTLFAMFASHFFTDDIILGLTNVGGILLIGLGINILEIKKLRIMNMLPSLVIVVLLLWIFN
ncbi:hypothetical protein ING2E5B_2363 [Fermentimonas caenicola]|uniref:Transport protein n=1 Tax=Fermentimonas caenicola TaxID=1562970 RepID=A0A098C3U8_9BACT|nr:hypothetical protein ING2E5B_2363 [Fermentimonas caenicola]